jgi:L-fuconolactonase
MQRRDFLGAAALSVTALATGRGETAEDRLPPPIVDVHTHFFDPGRKGSVPWPPKDDPVLYKRTLPDDYRKALPDGIRSRVQGTVVVECSAWVEDNQWILDLAEKDKFLLGLVGRLLPADEGFAKNLDRFAKNPLFRGIRIVAPEVKECLDKPEIGRKLSLLADKGLTLDVNGSPRMMQIAAELVEKHPELQIVVDHCGNVPIDGKPPKDEWRRAVEKVAKSPRTYCKVSDLGACTGKDKQRAPTDVAFYKPTLDAIWDAFGEDRVLFGSDWPVSDHFAKLSDLFAVLEGYLAGKPAAAATKYFAENSKKAYGWQPR